MSDSIRDDIEAAMKESESREEIVDAAIENTEDEVADEESGKAGDIESSAEGTSEPETSKDKAPDPAAAPTEEVTESEGTWDHNRAPTSWSPKVRESWGKLPEDVRKEIIRREEASVMGVRKLQEDFQPVRQFAENLTPFIQEARQLGADPGQYIHNVMTVERQLRAPDPQAKFSALLDIADTYGIPLRQYLKASGTDVPAAPAAQPQLPPEVQRELQEMRAWRQSTEQQTLQQQIDGFRKDNEFFDDVRDHMAALIDSGAAKTLQEAYDAAIWVNPEVRSVMLSRQEAEKQKGKLTERQAAASGASVKTSGAADLDIDTDDDDSTEAIVRKAMRAANSGRV